MFVTVTEAQVDKALAALEKQSTAGAQAVFRAPPNTVEANAPIKVEPVPSCKDDGEDPGEREPPSRDDREDDLKAAWRVLNKSPHDLLPLVQEVLGDEWEAGESPNRLQGPCPIAKGECADDPRSAYLYPRENDPEGPPYVFCHHKTTCGYEESFFELIASELGSRAEAAKKIKKAAGLKPEPKRETAHKEHLASKLVEIVLGGGIELWATPDSEAYASAYVDGHRENARVRSKTTKQKLTRLCYRELGKTPSSQVLSDAINVLEAEALETGKRYEVFQRVGRDGGDIYLDLGQPDWSACRINAAGWEIVPLPSVRFVRSAGMKPLPVPVRGGNVSELRGFVNVGTDDDFLILVSWLVTALRPRGPYPVLCIHGEHSSAKSTTLSVLRDLIDPNVSARRAEPREVRDLMVAAKKAWAVSFDNLSTIPVWLSDSLCRLSTGGGFSTRQLFTDDDEIVFDAMRPIILSGIEDLATRPDLLDRAMIVRLPAISDEKRRDEEEFIPSFEAARPRILGALLDAVAMGLDRLPTVRLDKKPRLADFARWVAAVEPAFGCPHGKALDAYLNNRRMTNDLALDADPLVQPLRELLDKRSSWSGTASELLKDLKNRADDETRKQRGWPKAAHVLSGMLRRLAPNLRAIGIDYRQDRESGGARRKLIVLSREATRERKCEEANQPPEDEKKVA